MRPPAAPPPRRHRPLAVGRVARHESHVGVCLRHRPVEAAQEGVVLLLGQVAAPAGHLAKHGIGENLDVPVHARPEFRPDREVHRGEHFQLAVRQLLPDGANGLLDRRRPLAPFDLALRHAPLARRGLEPANAGVGVLQLPLRLLLGVRKVLYALYQLFYLGRLLRR